MRWAMAWTLNSGWMLVARLTALLLEPWKPVIWKGLIWVILTILNVNGWGFVCICHLCMKPQSNNSGILVFFRRNALFLALHQHSLLLKHDFVRKKVITKLNIFCRCSYEIPHMVCISDLNVIFRHNIKTKVRQLILPANWKRWSTEFLHDHSSNTVLSLSPLEIAWKLVAS